MLCSFSTTLPHFRDYLKQLSYQNRYCFLTHHSSASTSGAHSRRARLRRQIQLIFNFLFFFFNRVQLLITLLSKSQVHQEAVRMIKYCSLPPSDITHFQHQQILEAAIRCVFQIALGGSKERKSYSRSSSPATLLSPNYNGMTGEKHYHQRCINNYIHQAGTDLSPCESHSTG